MLFNLEEVAQRLDVPELQVRAWLGQFHWERRYDGSGQLLLADRDLEFLRLIKSLKDVDRSCESICRLIDQEPVAAEPPPEPAKPAPDGREQVETLKAVLRDLHPRAPRPFWRFWQRR